MGCSCQKKSKIGMARSSKKMQGSLIKVAAIGGGYVIGTTVRAQIIENSPAESFLAENPMVLNAGMAIGAGVLAMKQKGLIQDVLIGVAASGAAGVIEDVVAQTTSTSVGAVRAPRALGVNGPSGRSFMNSHRASTQYAQNQARVQVN